jgi:hypothetical protein
MSLVFRRWCGHRSSRGSARYTGVGRAAAPPAQAASARHRRQRRRPARYEVECKPGDDWRAWPVLGVIPHLHLLFGCERRGSFRRRRGGAPQSVLGRRKIGGPSKSRAAAPRAFNSGIAQEGDLSFGILRHCCAMATAQYPPKCYSLGARLSSGHGVSGGGHATERSSEIFRLCVRWGRSQGPMRTIGAD